MCAVCDGSAAGAHASRVDGAHGRCAVNVTHVRTTKQKRVLFVTLYVHIRSIGGGAFPHPRFSEYSYFNINIYNYYIRLDDLPVLVTLVVSISIINLL